MRAERERAHRGVGAVTHAFVAVVVVIAAVAIAAVVVLYCIFFFFFFFLLLAGYFGLCTHDQLNFEC